METANDIITDALQELIVQAAEQPVQAVDFQTGRRYLNRMMAGLDADGIALGYTVVTSPDDLVTVPDGAIQGIVFNLAILLATTYGVPVGQLLAIKADGGLKTMRNIAVTIQPTSYPCTLPIGSGNEGVNSTDDYHFYGCSEDEILTEQGGSILLEDS